MYNDDDAGLSSLFPFEKEGAPFFPSMLFLLTGEGYLPYLLE